VLSVKDNGHGIKAEDRARLFTPFFTTKGPGRGMGMGLTIAWRVVQSLGGTLDIDSIPGQGACFTLRVPRSQRTRVVA
jgi:signal transduction histidine kinase